MQSFLYVVPAYIYVATVNPVVIDRYGILLKGKDLQNGMMTKNLFKNNKLLPKNYRHYGKIA